MTTPSPMLPAMTLPELAIWPPTTLAGASSIRTPSSALARAWVPRIGTSWPARPIWVPISLLATVLPLRGGIEDVDAVSLIAGDDVPAAGRPRSGRLADLVVRPRAAARHRRRCRG